jgi:ribosomal protein L14E/L6E/L27E
MNERKDSFLQREQTEGTTIVKSLTGRDAGRLFAVISEEDPFFFLADGMIRRISNPKKKRKKHVKVIGTIQTEQAVWTQTEPIRTPAVLDSEIRKAIKAFAKDCNE